MKTARSLLLLFVVAAASAGLARPSTPTPMASPAEQREHSLALELSDRGRTVLERVCADSTVVVTVRCGSGFRKQEARLYPTDTSRFGYVVTGSQQKKECFEKASCSEAEEEESASLAGASSKSGFYSNLQTSERRDSSKLAASSEEQLWIDKIGVCAVVPRSVDPGQVEEALAAALALDRSRGDSVKVLTSP